MENPLMNLRSTRIAAVLALGLAILGTAAHAHGPEGSDVAAVAVTASTDETPFGREGDPKHVARTVAIDMLDTMRFGPATIRVRQGETIRFAARNKGKIMHEIVLGTLDGLQAHGTAMNKHPGMEHDEPYMRHVAPGKQRDLVWQFTKAGEFHYACLLPGHFEAGMVGKIVVAAR